MRKRHLEGGPRANPLCLGWSSPSRRALPPRAPSCAPARLKKGVDARRQLRGSCRRWSRDAPRLPSAWTRPWSERGRGEERGRGTLSYGTSSSPPASFDPYCASGTVRVLRKGFRFFYSLSPGEPTMIHNSPLRNSPLSERGERLSPRVAFLRALGDSTLDSSGPVSSFPCSSIARGYTWDIYI